MVAPEIVTVPLEKSFATNVFYYCIDFRSFCPLTSHYSIKLSSSNLHPEYNSSNNIFLFHFEISSATYFCHISYYCAPFKYWNWTVGPDEFFSKQFFNCTSVKYILHFTRTSEECEKVLYTWNFTKCSNTAQFTHMERRTHFVFCFSVSWVQRHKCSCRAKSEVDPIGQP